MEEMSELYGRTENHLYDNLETNNSVNANTHDVNTTNSMPSNKNMYGRKDYNNQSTDIHTTHSHLQLSEQYSQSNDSSYELDTASKHSNYIENNNDDLENPYTTNILEKIPNCETKLFIMALSKKLNRSDEEIYPILKYLIIDHWIETISQLNRFNLKDLRNLPIPYTFLRYLNEQLPYADNIINQYKNETLSDTRYEFGIPTNPSNISNPVTQFLHNFCITENIPLAIENEIIDCIVHKNWYDSIEVLKNITKEQWKILCLPENISTKLWIKIRQFFEEQSVEKIIIKAGEHIGRTPDQLKSTIETLLAAGYDTSFQIKKMSEEQWVELKLPLRLYIAVQSEINSKNDDNQGLDYTVTNMNDSGFQTQNFDEYIINSPSEIKKKEISVEEFLIKVSKEVDRPFFEIEPLIHKIVQENWIETIDAARTLTSQEWIDMGVPRRFVDAIQEGLKNPTLLNMQLVQWTSVTPCIFPYDLHHSIWKLESEVPPSEVPHVFKAFLRLFEILMCSPYDPTKRIVRKSNPNFQARAAKYKATDFLLKSLGYQDVGDRYLLQVLYVTRVTEAHAAFAQLAQKYRDRGRKSHRGIRRDIFSAIH